MDPYSEQQVLLSTGSFSGFRPLGELGSNYLSASTAYRQPLCGNKEGWGPLSPYRYDFTPCFIDVWIAIVAVGGLFLGLGAVWLLRKQKPIATNKNFHFWLKQVIWDLPLPLDLYKAQQLTPWTSSLSSPPSLPMLSHSSSFKSSTLVPSRLAIFGSGRLS